MPDSRKRVPIVLATEWAAGESPSSPWLRPAGQETADACVPQAGAGLKGKTNVLHSRKPFPPCTSVSPSVQGLGED